MIGEGKLFNLRKLKSMTVKEIIEKFWEDWEEQEYKPEMGSPNYVECDHHISFRAIRTNAIPYCCKCGKEFSGV